EYAVPLAVPPREYRHVYRGEINNLIAPIRGDLVLHSIRQDSGIAVDLLDLDVGEVEHRDLVMGQELQAVRAAIAHAIPIDSGEIGRDQLLEGVYILFLQRPPDALLLQREFVAQVFVVRRRRASGGP